VSEVLKSGWHFLVPIAFLVYALMYPDVTMLTPEKAAIVSTAYAHGAGDEPSATAVSAGHSPACLRRS
jgi:TRAP-type uncharacterized transport system fused permease subunit